MCVKYKKNLYEGDPVLIYLKLVRDNVRCVCIKILKALGNCVMALGHGKFLHAGGDAKDSGCHDKGWRYSKVSLSNRRATTTFPIYLLCYVNFCHERVLRYPISRVYVYFSSSGRCSFLSHSLSLSLGTLCARGRSFFEKVVLEKRLRFCASWKVRRDIFARKKGTFARGEKRFMPEKISSPDLFSSKYTVREWSYILLLRITRILTSNFAKANQSEIELKIQKHLVSGPKYEDIKCIPLGGKARIENLSRMNQRVFSDIQFK